MSVTAKRSAWDAQVHHAAAAPPLAALALYAAGAASAVFAHRPLAVAALAVVLAAAGTLALALTHPHLAVLAHGAASIVFAAAWMTLAQFGSPFRAPEVLALLTALAVLWPLYPLVHAADRRERAAALDRARSLLGKGGRGGDWPGMLAALGLPRIQVEDTVQNPAGYTKVLRLPPDGSITFKRVRGALEQIEVALDAEPGWVRAERGRGARVLVHVTTRDVLADTIPLPRSSGPRSINDEFDIGVSETGEILWVLLREVAVLIVGVRGVGKSNLFNVLIERLGHCVDVLLWGIDLKGGRTLRPWLAPWLDGKTDRPVLDWCATDREEAQLILQAALTAIEVRSASGAGGEKITPSPEQPAIIVLCDEISSLVGMHAPGARGSTNLLTMVTQLGRSEAVDSVLAAQRGTVTMTGSGDLKSQLTLRIALGGMSEADAQSVLGDTQLAKMVANLKHPGSICVQRGDARPVPAKSYRVEPGDVYEMAQSCSELRPGPEADLEAALAAVYAQRWSMARAGHLLTGKPKAPGAAPAEPPAAAPKPAPGARPSGLVPIPPPPSTGPAWRTATGEPIPRGTEHISDREVDAAFRDLVRGEHFDTKAPHAGRTRMLGLLDTAGPAGAGPTELTRQLNENGIGCVRQTVQEWLASAVRDGDVVNRGGTYIHRGHAS